jgi:hypothetical protein
MSWRLYLANYHHMSNFVRSKPSSLYIYIHIGGTGRRGEGGGG